MLLLLAMACGADTRLDRLDREVAELQAEIDVCPTRRDVDQGAPDDEDVCPDVGGPWSESVVPIGPETYLVDPVCWHSVVDSRESRSHLASLAYRQASGAEDVDGWYLFGVERDFLPAALGLRYGDAVTAVDGRAVTDLDAADVQALALGNDRIVVTGLRSGRPFRTEIDVSPSMFAGSCAVVDAPYGDRVARTDGVVPLGDDHFAVTSDWLARQLADTEALAKMARAIPHRGPDGEIDGYRLSGIRRDSALDALGIKNGDVVQAVNGMAVPSPDDADTVWASLSGAKTFTFAVVRRGEPRTLTYEITP